MSMRVASGNSTMSSQKPKLLSIDDVVKLAERTRMRTTLEARHLMLVQTQKMVRGDSVMSRPDTAIVCEDSSLEDREESASPSGQGTEKGRGGGEGMWEREESHAPPPGFVRDVRISVKPRHRHFGAFSQDGRHRLSLSRLGTEYAGLLPSSLLNAVSPRNEGKDSRVSGGVCGCSEASSAVVCAECRKLGTESVASQRIQTTLPPLNFHEKHVTSSERVRRARPDLTPREIQEKLDAGKISSSSLLFPRHRRHKKAETDEEDEDLDDTPRENGPQQEGKCLVTKEDSNARIQSTEMADQKSGPVVGVPKQASTPVKTPSRPNSLALVSRLKVRLKNGEATTPLFFMDLKHMNSKIFHGATARSLTLPGQERKKRSLRSEVKPLWPAFISPRKCQLIQEPLYKAYFAPPLLAKRLQVPNPAFFAGIDDPYLLPERLPDMLEFSGGAMAITDPNALVSDFYAKREQSPVEPVALDDVPAISASAGDTSVSPVGPGISVSPCLSGSMDTSVSASVAVTSGSPGSTVTPVSLGTPFTSATTADDSASPGVPVTSDSGVLTSVRSASSVFAVNSESSVGTETPESSAVQTPSTSVPCAASTTSPVTGITASSAVPTVSPVSTPVAGIATSSTALSITPASTPVAAPADYGIAAVSSRPTSVDAASAPASTLSSAVATGTPASVGHTGNAV